MTPQQRLQEAKDQAAKEAGIGDKWFMPDCLMPFENRMNRAAELYGNAMYEAGKKEAIEQSESGRYMEDLQEMLKRSTGEAATYRKALEEIEKRLSKMYVGSMDIDAFSGEYLSIIKFAQEALKP